MKTKRQIFIDAYERPFKHARRPRRLGPPLARRWHCYQRKRVRSAGYGGDCHKSPAAWTLAGRGRSPPHKFLCIMQAGLSPPTSGGIRFLFCYASFELYMRQISPSSVYPTDLLDGIIETTVLYTKRNCVTAYFSGYINTYLNKYRRISQSATKRIRN